MKTDLSDKIVSFFRLPFSFIFALTFSLTAPPFCFAQVLSTQTPITVRTNIFPLDRIVLKNGKEYRGIIRHEKDGEIELLVERKWFKKRFKTQYKKIEKREKFEIVKMKEYYLSRLNRWEKDLKQHSFSAELNYYLKEQISKISEISSDMRPLFCRLKIPKKRIRKTELSPPAAKRVAGIAWKHQLHSVGDHKIRTLLIKLKKKGVDVKFEKFDHGGELIYDLPSDRQWEFKKAIIRYELVKGRRFQNVGDRFFGEDQPLQLKDVIETFIKNLPKTSVKQDIGSLPVANHESALEKRSWWKGIHKTLEKEWAGSENTKIPTCIYISRQSPASNSNGVSIESVLVVRTKDGKWNVCHRFESYSNPKEVKNQYIEFLRKDKGIKKAILAGESLGITGDLEINQALRFGAMVHIASQKSKDVLRKFLELHSKHIEVPVGVPDRP